MRHFNINQSFEINHFKLSGNFNFLLNFINFDYKIHILELLEKIEKIAITTTKIFSTELVNLRKIYEYIFKQINLSWGLTDPISPLKEIVSVFKKRHWSQLNQFEKLSINDLYFISSNIGAHTNDNLDEQYVNNILFFKLIYDVHTLLKFLCSKVLDNKNTKINDFSLSLYADLIKKNKLAQVKQEEDIQKFYEVKEIEKFVNWYFDKYYSNGIRPNNKNIEQMFYTNFSDNQNNSLNIEQLIILKKNIEANLGYIKFRKGNKELRKLIQNKLEIYKKNK